jgi:hypothetical protein
MLTVKNKIQLMNVKPCFHQNLNITKQIVMEVEDSVEDLPNTPPEIKL